ncbi:triple tyrosine motif-containing protein [Clostridium sp.]|uniref:triple tyrosine motif-containing protein n=1 Tax=Clostridium sp. TaxID=1506 RepID=UPI003F3510D7
MGEILITFDKESKEILNGEINIKAITEVEKDEIENTNDLEYKFLEGTDGLWSPIQDFSTKNMCRWKPKGSKKYMIMVQAKNKNSKKPFDYLGKVEYEIEEEECDKLINDVILDKTLLAIGEKLSIEVITDELVLYRFWISGKQGWEPLKDYSTENKLIYTAVDSGSYEILVECKKPDSDNNVDEFATVKFNVEDNLSVEIIDFQCSTEDILIGKDLSFTVECNAKEGRDILYKFLKIDKTGKVSCLQEYSTRNTVTFIEKEKGQYKLLCLVRDMFSSKDYDDRALILYEVKPYKDISIKKFSADMNSPQLINTKINLNAVVEGGNEIVYRYIIEGTIAEDTGFIRNNYFEWEPKAQGEYVITLQVKDISCEDEYEDVQTLKFKIEKKCDKPVKIIDVITNKKRKCVIGDIINIKVKAEGGTDLRYEFLVYKNGKEKERIDYGYSNWTNFIPEEVGEYEIEVRVVDRYSSKEFDSHSFVYFKVKEYAEAEIDYVLFSSKETYLVGDMVEIESIIQNSKNVVYRYITKINGHEVEDTGYIDSRKLRIRPKCPGKYSFEIYAKNIKCKEDYDCKKELSLYVQEAVAVTNTRIKILEDELKINEEITFEASSEGGKEVCYEFFIMEKGNWTKVQEYSRKNYYTFMPFSKGKYRVLVLSKSYHRKHNYEDYTSIEFEI